MSGQHPGPYGPTPGGPPYRPAPIPGRFGVPARVVCALVPLLSFGLLGVVPSLLLAVRRRRAYDILGAVVYCGLLLTLFVSLGIAGTLNDPTADFTGSITLAVLWLTPTLHFLALDSRTVWESRPLPVAPQAVVPSYGPPVGPPYAPQAAAPYAPTAPGYGAPAPVPAPNPIPAPAPAPAVETSHDLRELGELLRRQAREGGS
ncbi:hypothetical protein ACFVXG_07240 [Kitasatospora sp. NPDC058162]|uniref:hypothetical protein n=1 Tax=Kitasatospora sp. NPDC058162 TaxID=3346362 RepID=UPI0036DB06B8